MDSILALRSGEEIDAVARAELAEARRELNSIVSRAEHPDADNTLRPLNRLVLRLGSVRRAISLLRNVHPAADVREACELSEREIAKFFTELSLDRRTYDRIAAVGVDDLDPVARRFVEVVLRDFRRAGVDRDEEVRAEVRRIRERLVQLGQQFTRNIVTDVRSVEVELDELEGLPPDWVRAHPPGPEGTVRVSTDYPDYHPFMIYARSPRARAELYREFRSRAWPGNEIVLEEILEQRFRLARILGYPHWADYSTEDKMIRSGEAIARFIARVAEAADERSHVEYAQLLERKRAETPHAEEVFDWEKGHLEELVRNETYRVDSRDLRPYFPYRSVRDGILGLVERLFGIEFRAAPDAPRWHEDVEVLDAYEGDDPIGRLYLDMHPRESKYKHAAMFPIVQGVRGGPRPVAALVCNFPRPGPDEPALLEHDDVVTFFHEFGHLLHHLFGQDVEWEEFSGTGTEWDFVEVPSQLFEEWAWDADVLRSFARHHETGQPIPEELIERLRAAREFGRGIAVRTQMYYAALSLRCHLADPSALDLDDLQRELQNHYSRFRAIEGTHFHTSFGHLDGYSALYYTYMWSLVIEKDLLSVFQERGLMDVETAQRYRKSVLAVGGSKPADALVRDFLGRDYGFEAFETWLASGEASRVS